MYSKLLSSFLFLLMVYSVHCHVWNSSTVTLPNITVDDRIYRGFDEGIDKYPHATFLFFEMTSPASCGGSLIMVQAVLTAAHCVDELRYHRGKMFAFFGATIPIKARAVRQVIDYEINPNYNDHDGGSNIAVVFLKQRVPLEYYIKKIPLANKDPAIESIVFSVGWGKQRVGDKPPMIPDFSKVRTMKGTKQRIINNHDCKTYAHVKIVPQYLCSVPEIGHFYKDDSGDGLILKKNDVFRLVGVLSYVANGVSVHSSTFKFRDWIISSCRQLFFRNCHH